MHTPERAHQFMVATLRPIRTTALTVVEPAAIAFAGVGGLFTQMLGPSHFALAIILLFFNLLDLTVGALKAIRSPSERFDKITLLGGILGKLILWSMVFVAVALEFATKALIEMFSGGEAVPILLDPLMGKGVIAAVALFLLITGEALSVLNNATLSVGDNMRVAAFLRFFLDKIKWEQGHGDQPFPARREMDTDALRVEEELKKRVQPEVKP